MLRRILSPLLALLIAVPLLSACEPDEPVEQSEAEIIVNSLTYTWQDPAPAMLAFRLVALERGWQSDGQYGIDAYAPFVEAFMERESGYCPYTLGGGRVDTSPGCVVTRQGSRSDSGFGQVLMSVHARWLCGQEGLCTKWDVIASPWNSMTALVALIERSGSQPWCFTPKLRRGAICRLAP